MSGLVGVGAIEPWDENGMLRRTLIIAIMGATGLGVASCRWPYRFRPPYHEPSAPKGAARSHSVAEADPDEAPRPPSGATGHGAAAGSAAGG